MESGVQFMLILLIVFPQINDLLLQNSSKVFQWVYSRVSERHKRPERIVKGLWNNC